MPKIPVSAEGTLKRLGFAALRFLGTHEEVMDLRAAGKRRRDPDLRALVRRRTEERKQLLLVTKSYRAKLIEAGGVPVHDGSRRPQAESRPVLVLALERPEERPLSASPTRRIEAATERIFAFVRDHPGCTSRQIRQKVSGSPHDLQPALHLLRDRYAIAATDGPRGAKLWHVIIPPPPPEEVTGVPV